jgi:hypothetical protein
VALHQPDECAIPFSIRSGTPPPGSRGNVSGPLYFVSLGSFEMKLLLIAA